MMALRLQGLQKRETDCKSLSSATNRTEYMTKIIIQRDTRVTGLLVIL